ncbi:hypothetical protein ACQUW5_14795 [Legionella sp. CNM-1927-20]|uniref:hypothetical protein n=1 Tax=Legionella sp. CNM-1927-20 TaxID=3422221 RepID=UPI00403AAF48
MKLAINGTEYDINDAYSLVELIDNSPENLHQEIILKLLDPASFSNIITENDQLIALLGSLINDSEVSKVVSFIITNKQEFKRLIPTTYALKQILKVVNDKYAESIIQYILNDQNEFDRLIKDQDRLLKLLAFLDKEFPDYTKKVFEKIISFNDDKFNKLIGDRENLIEFAKKYPNFRDKLLNKALSFGTTISGLVEFGKAIKNYKLMQDSVKQEILQFIQNKLLNCLLDKNVNISFIQFFETTKDLLSDKFKADLFQALLESNNELLKLRINNLKDLLKVLEILPAYLAYKLFNRVLNDNELFIHFIRDNKTLSNLWFGASMDSDELMFKCAVPLWAREYLLSESFLYAQSEHIVNLKRRARFGSEGYFFTLQTRFHSSDDRSPRSIAGTILGVLNAEEANFISAIENKQHNKLINIIERAITNDSLLERIFAFSDSKGHPFSLKALFKLIPNENDRIYKLIQAIVKNDRLNASVDLISSLSDLSSVFELNSAIENDKSIDFNKIKNEIANRIKKNSISYSSLNLFLSILIAKNEKISNESPIKNHLNDLISFVKNNRMRVLPSLRATVSFFLQANGKIKIKGKTHDEIAAQKEIIKQSLVDDISIDYEEIIADINNNNNTLDSSQRELKNQIAFDKMLQRGKTQPNLVRPLFKAPQFASQFDGEQLCALALSDIEIANCILDTIVEKFNAGEISFKNIRALIRTYPSISYPILQHLNVVGLQLDMIADIHPEAANAILKTPNFNNLAKKWGQNGGLVILAKKHHETAKVILKDPKLSELLTDDNLIEIATRNPNIINDIRGNKKIMRRVSEETKVALEEVYSLLPPSQQDSEPTIQSLRL